MNELASLMVTNEELSSSNASISCCNLPTVKYWRVHVSSSGIEEDGISVSHLIAGTGVTVLGSRSLLRAEEALDSTR